MMGAHDVFISYSHEDKPVADGACAVLERYGVRCWIAPRDVTPGISYGESIMDAIVGARLMVLVFSENANKSPQVEREIERAVSKGKWLIPIRIEDVMPKKSFEYFISTTHWLDALTPPMEQHLEQLAEAVRDLLASLSDPSTSQQVDRSRHADDTIPDADQLSAQAAFNLGYWRQTHGDLSGAAAAYQQAIDSGDRNAVASAAVNLGVLRERQGDVSGAEAAYQLVIDSGHRVCIPQAAYNLGCLRQERGDVSRAAALYQLAIDSGHANYAPNSAYNLGILRYEQGDFSAAAEAWQLAIDSGHAEWAPKAAVNLGVLRERQTDVAGAAAAYQIAIDSGQPDYAPRAAANLGVLRAKQGDVAGAMAAYQFAIDCGHATWTPAAEYQLGVLRAEQGDISGAIAAYQLAKDSGQPDYAAAASVKLEALRSQHPTISESSRAPREKSNRWRLGRRARVDDGPDSVSGNRTRDMRNAPSSTSSDNATESPASAFKLGQQREEAGDFAGAAAAFQQCIESDDPHYVGRAAILLAGIRLKQGDNAGGIAAFQIAVDRGSAEWAAISQRCLAELRVGG